MTKKYKILGKYIKDTSGETPNIETYIFVKDRISKYQLNIDINSKPLKNKMIEIETTLKFSDKEQSKKKVITALTVGSVIGHLIIGTGLALLVNTDINPKARTLFRSLLILPWIFTAVVVAVNWQLLLNPFGIINYGLDKLGMINEPLDWLGDPSLAMWSLLLISTWRGYPFIMVSFLSGLQSIPKELYEAAEIDGAGFFGKFWHVTIPQLKPVIYGVALLDLIWTFQLFPLVWLTTGGGPGRSTEVLSTMTFRYAFVNFEFSQASTVAVSILIISAAFTIFYLRNEKSRI